MTGLWNPTGRPSRAMTEEQAGKVLKVAVGRDFSFVKLVRLKSRYGATHAAREDGELACGNRPRTDAPVTEINVELTEVTCRACRSQLGVGDNTDATVRHEALFVLSITVGLRPGELRKLTWDLVDLDAGVIHVWRSASRSGDVKTPKSKRSLTRPGIRASTAKPGSNSREQLGLGLSLLDWKIIRKMLWSLGDSNP